MDPAIISTPSRILRELTPTEKEKLNHMIQIWSKIPFTMLLILYPIAALIYFTLKDRLFDYFGNYTYIFVALLFILPILQTVYISLKNKTEANKYRLDLTEPVSVLTGVANIYRSQKAPYVPQTQIWIGGLRFDGGQLIGTEKMLIDYIKEGATATIEFSPNSNYVWNVNNLNKVQ